MCWRLSTSRQSGETIKISNNVSPKVVLEIAKGLTYEEAGVVCKVVDEYMISPEQFVTAEHVAKHAAKLFSRRAATGAQSRDQDSRVREVAQAVIDNMFSREGTTPYTHNGYLKRFSLDPAIRKKLSTDYDLILIDEAQDLNPVTIGVIADQNIPAIFVGDRHQHIYEFNGAKDDGLCSAADVELRLTRSFRFDPAVAWIANKVVALKVGFAPGSSVYKI